MSVPLTSIPFFIQECIAATSACKLVHNFFLTYTLFLSFAAVDSIFPPLYINAPCLKVESDLMAALIAKFIYFCFLLVGMNYHCVYLYTILQI